MNPIVHIDARPAEIDAYYPVQAELVGNVSEALEALMTGVAKRTLARSEKVKVPNH